MFDLTHFRAYTYEQQVLARENNLSLIGTAAIVGDEHSPITYFVCTKNADKLVAMITRYDQGNEFIEQEDIRIDAQAEGRHMALVECIDAVTKLCEERCPGVQHQTARHVLFGSSTNLPL